MKLNRWILPAAVALAAWVAPGAASATTLTGSNYNLTAYSGDTKVIFLYKSAAYEDKLSLITPRDSGTIFDNWQTGEGATVDLGYLGLAGSTIQFKLDVVQTGQSYTTGVRNADDGQYHAHYASSFADFGVGDLPAASAAALSQYAGQEMLFVGFEDMNFFDYDYNDLIIAVVDPPFDAPEPASLAILGSGLAGLALWRRKRRA